MAFASSDLFAKLEKKVEEQQKEQRKEIDDLKKWNADLESRLRTIENAEKPETEVLSVLPN